MSEQKIITGDAFDLIREVPDETMQLILCDPVYQDHEQYAMLAREAQRILVPGGSLVAQTGAIHRWENESIMDQNKGDLIHMPILMEMQTGGFTYIWKYRAVRSAIPFLWFQKPGDVFKRAAIKTSWFGSRDKDRHRWGDGTAGYLYLISRLTDEVGVVLDPFTGSGTVPVAAKMFGRSCLAFEIDPTVAGEARVRVAETMDPLIPLTWNEIEQVKMRIIGEEDKAE